MKRIVSLACAVVLGAPMLVACGSSSSSSTVSPTGTAALGSPTTSAADTSASTPTTTTVATTTTTVAAQQSGPPPCRAGGLSLSFLGQQGGMGQGEIGFVLRNVSGTSCRTYGYPGVLFLDRGGSPLPTIPTHTTRDFFGASPEAPLLIAPGATASFRLDVTHGVASSAGCATAYGLQVIPPNDTATLRTTIPEGAYECQTANVSPLRAGQAAYP